MAKEKISIWIFSASKPGVRFSLTPQRLVTALACLQRVIIAGVIALFGIMRGGSAFALITPGGLIADKLLDHKIGFVVDEIIRLREYEEQLRLRASLLDEILIDTHGLATNTAQYSFAEEEKSKTLLGIGSGDVPEKELLINRLELHQEQLRSIPLGAPTMGRISSKFGRRKSPFNGKWLMHKGLDLAVDRRSAIVATADGIVAFAGRKKGFGRLVIVDHQNGYETYYGHMQKVTAKAGERICRGEKIGQVGSSGKSTGPHVHYEIRFNNTRFDPLPFLQAADFFNEIATDKQV